MYLYLYIHIYIYAYTLIPISVCIYIYYTYIPVSLSVFSSFIWRQLALSWSWVGLQRFGKTWLCEGLKSCLGNKWGGGQPLLLYLGISRQPATKNQGSSEAGVQKEGNIKNSSLYTPSSLFVTWCHVKTAFSTTNKTALLTTNNACTKKKGVCTRNSQFTLPPVAPLARHGLQVPVSLSYAACSL